MPLSQAQARHNKLAKFYTLDSEGKWVRDYKPITKRGRLTGMSAADSLKQRADESTAAFLAAAAAGVAYGSHCAKCGTNSSSKLARRNGHPALYCSPCSQDPLEPAQLWASRPFKECGLAGCADCTSVQPALRGGNLGKKRKGTHSSSKKKAAAKRAAAAKLAKPCGLCAQPCVVCLATWVTLSLLFQSRLA